MAIVRMTLEELRKKQVNPEELKRLKNMPDELIDVNDIPPPSETAKRVQNQLSKKTVDNLTNK